MLPRHKGTKKFIQVVPSLRGLRTRAIPAGVTALHSPGLVKLYDVFILLLPQSVVSKLILAEEKHGKRSVFP